MENIVVGIEGLVGAGKTSICRKLIQIMPNTILLNGGNLYRAIVYTMMQKGQSLENLKSNINNIDIKQVMDMLRIEIRIENNETNFYIDNILVDEEKIQSKEASLAVSVVGGKADNTKLFKFAYDLIENLKQKYNVIVSGRAVQKIYPKLDYHFFITADLEERTKRKYSQYNGEVDIKEVKENIVKRDKLQEEAGFYNTNEKTIIVDVTNCNTIEKATEKVLQYIKIKETI